MYSWQPQQQGLRELVALLRDAANPSCRDHALIHQRLSLFSDYPDYNAYLVYILLQSKHEDINTRLVAGLQLKNSLKNNFNSIQLVVLDYVKQSCIYILNNPDTESAINKTISFIIAAIVRRGQVHNWYQVIYILLEKLNDTQQNTVQVKLALDTLVMICQDAAPELDVEVQPGIRPLRYMLPKFIQFYSNPDPHLKVQAIHATSQFVLLKSDSFIHYIDKILSSLYAITDTTPRVRQELGCIMTVLLEAFPEKLEPYLIQTIEFMINATTDTNPEIVLAACDFWEQYAHMNRYKEQLDSYLPKLIPCLLNLMVYSDKDLLDIETIQHNETSSTQQVSTTKYYPDNTTNTNNGNNPATAAAAAVVAAAAAVNKSNRNDELSDVEEEESDFDDDISTSSSNGTISSHIHQHSNSSSDLHISDDNDVEDDEFYSEDSLRKASARALEIISVTFGDNVASILLERLLNHTLQDTNWVVRESGILALGAAAVGGINVIRQELVKLIPFLLKSMQDPQPSVRSISCWVVSRFSNWLAHQENEHKEFFEPVLFGLLHQLLDSNKRVQEFACTAFITLAEQSRSHQLSPYIYQILVHTNRAFALYKRKNRLYLYDVMGTLADTVGEKLNQPQFIYLLMPPLIAKWNELSDKDTDLFPLLECLSNITAALGSGFIQYVDPVLTRCVKLISSTLQDQILADQHPEEMMPPNVEFLIAPLDLLSGIVQGLGPKIEPLIAQTNPPLLSLLGRCIHDPVSEVLQSTFVLIGDIAGASFPLLVPYLHFYVREMIHILHNREYIIPISVYNNVLWALGEIMMRWESDQVQPYIPSLIDVLLPLLTLPLPDSIHENTMIAIGRIGLSCPTPMAPYLKSFVKPWLQKSLSVREGEEKDTAFRGLCAIIRFNARDAHDDLGLLLVAFSTLQKPSDALYVEITNVVKGYHSITHHEQWKAYMDQLEPEALTFISNIITTTNL